VQGLINRLLRDDSGATAIEYGLLVGLIAVVMITAYQNFANQLVNTYLIVNGYTSNAMAKNSP